MEWKEIVKKNNLDISIINLNFLERERIDAEFYSNIYLTNEERIKNLETTSLGDICIIKSGTTPKDRDDSLTEGAILLKTTDIRNKPLSHNADYYHISEEINQKMKSTQLKNGDVLINIVGATLDVIGRVSFVPNNFPQANITQAMALISSKNNAFLPSYIFTFLLSKYGNLQSKRLARPTGQFNLNLQEVSAIRIPKANINFQNAINEIISEYQNLSERSEQLHKKAERLLVEEINLEGYVPNNDNTSVRELTECLTDNRFDAEYWEPRFDEMEERVSIISQQELGDIVSIQKGIDPGSEAYTESGKPFVRVSDISIYGIEDGDKKISDELYEELKDNYKPQKGEVLFTKDGTIGISFALHEDIDAIVSSAFLRLKPKIKINIDYLTLVLNSLYCKFQIERMSGGAIIAHLKPESVKKIKVPVLSDAKQEELAEKAVSSLRLRNEAKELLEKAKRAVEIFIEKDEQEALKYLAP